MEPEIDKTESMSTSDTHGQDQHQPGGMQPPQRPYGRIDREHPIGGEMSDIVRGLLRHIRLPWLTSITLGHQYWPSSAFLTAVSVLG